MESRHLCHWLGCNWALNVVGSGMGRGADTAGFWLVGCRAGEGRLRPGQLLIRQGINATILNSFRNPFALLKSEA